MTDPVAEAAAALAKQQAEPSLLEKAMDTIHDLEEKVEHLIHPAGNGIADDTAAVQSGAALPAGEAIPNVLPDLTSGIASGSKESATTGSITYSESAEPGNVGGQSESGLTLIPITGVVENATHESLTSTSMASLGADTTGTTGTTSVMADLPNAALVAVEQPVIAASAPAVSTVGIQGVIAAESAEPVKLASAATSAIKAGVANIKHHLSIRGFEQSAVADIHAELAAIEKWL